MSKWKTDNWVVSEYNWYDEVRSKMTPSNKFEIHDCTLRDGAHVVDFTDKERINFVATLSDLGVTRVEVESRANVIKRQSIIPPEKHWETLKNLANMGLKVKVFTMRNVQEGQAGIDQSLKYDVKNIVLQEPVHRERLKDLGQTVEQRIKQINEVVKYAKDRGCYVDFFTNRITEGELPYTLKIAKAGVEAGADSLCITDSEGTGTPGTFQFLVKKYIEVGKGKLPVEIHTHNDFGLALANTIASYEAGASVAHCSVNNLGSRAGNASVEEVIVALHVLYGVELGIKYEKLYDVCKLVEEMQQWPLAKNRPFYGYGIYEAPYKLKYFGKTTIER